MVSAVLGWILVGLVAGVLAKLIMPGRDPGGLVATVLIGMAGAILAGYVGSALGLYRSGAPAGWLGATSGAVALLAAYRIIVRIRS